MQSRYVTAAIVLALLLVGSGGALPTEDEVYPIWWSPSLELDSLDQIDDRLERKFWPDQSEGIPVYKGEWPGDDQSFIDSCASYDKLRKEGYYARYNHDMKILLFHTAKCHAIEMLREANPAKKSYVRDFKLDADSINYLPALVDASASCDRLCRQYVANERRISWKEFAGLDSQSMKYEGDYVMEGEVSGSDLTLEILARADFNGDGLEDLLLMVDADAIGGTWGTTRLYLLSREKPESVLWVLDAEDEICSPVSYRPCDADYDHPEALRRTN